MIPDHLIDKAAAAIYESSVFGDKFVYDAWHDLADDNQVKITTCIFARAALETVAADIWQDGYDSGVHDEFTSQDWTGREVQPNRKNPYRASETG